MFSISEATRNAEIATGTYILHVISTGAFYWSVNFVCFWKSAAMSLLVEHEWGDVQKNVCTAFEVGMTLDKLFTNQFSAFSWEAKYAITSLKLQIFVRL